MVDHEIVVFGDIEMGAGNLTDDFIADKALAKEIKKLAKEPHQVDLIMNGDTFDFLKCPSQLQPHSIYPRHITEEISLDKLELMYQAHKPVFNALKKFVAKRNKHIYFTIGNHDHDLVYPKVQEQLQKILGSKSRVHFPGLIYERGNVYVEHGHQYDFLFSINFEKLFLKHKGQSILNIPMVSFGLISKFMTFKEKHPFLERIFPKPALFSHHKVIAKKFNRTTISYFVKSLVYYPFRYYSDPTYSFPTNLIREIFKRIKTLHWDVDSIMHIFAKKKKTKHKIVVLGHIHEKRIEKKRARTLIHPGSWRDEYFFNSKTRELIPHSKGYVRIKVTDGNPEYELIHVHTKEQPFDFDDVLKNERKYLKKAAELEGYSLRI